MTLELRATPEEVMRGVEALREFGETRQVPELILHRLTVALEECGSNIVNHALKRDAGRTFHVTFEHTGATLVIELRDSGPPFDPTKAVVEETGDNDDRADGGWGIQLVRRYTDQMIYAREGHENVLRLFKTLGE